jgi:sulfite oxidase
MVAQCDTLPVYRRAEVQKQARENKKVWVTYKDGVYDLTQFAKNHPGGSDKLIMAAGGPIEPWWQQYPFHKVVNVISILEEYKVGQLHADDVLDEKQLPDFSELQTQHLDRSPLLRKLSNFPFCAETAQDYLSDHYYTPPKMHFERNHNLIPEIDAEDYELQLLKSKEDEEPISLSLEDIKQMP